MHLIIILNQHLDFFSVLESVYYIYSRERERVKHAIHIDFLTSSAYIYILSVMNIYRNVRPIDYVERKQTTYHLEGGRVGGSA